MCGIVASVGLDNKETQGGAALGIVEALRRLEYRGYDSAGVATIDGGHIHRLRVEGKINNLLEAVKKNKIPGSTAIGHTRWATHGAPSERNAHPHITDKVALVHNGIIENYQSLRKELEKSGSIFESDTDTEVIAHLITFYLKEGLDPEKSVRRTLRRLQGAYALAVIFVDFPEMLIVARSGSPLVVGASKDAMFAASDAIALASFCEQVSYLEEGDMAVITRDQAQFFDRNGVEVTRPLRDISSDGAPLSKNGYPHFMLKEIHEQPRVIADSLHVYFDSASQQFSYPQIPFRLDNISRVKLVACGTSYYAAMVGRYWIENIARIPTEVEIASEFRYQQPILDKDELTIFISQSGETADTLAALRYAKEQKVRNLAIVNVAESSMGIEAEGIIHTQAGVEIGVASTKAFTAQLTILASLSITLGRLNNALDEPAARILIHALSSAADQATQILKSEAGVREIAKTLQKNTSMLYIGRGTSYAIACEGALKIKEISYIHAESYAAGELKHGALALVDEQMPVVVVAPDDALFDKTASNLQETAARGGKIILLSNTKGITALKDQISAAIQLPDCHAFVAPLLYVIPLQLLAYHTALLRGTDVDQPRNLAKSVTVE